MPDEQLSQDAIAKIARYQRFVLLSVLLILISNILVAVTMRSGADGLALVFGCIQLGAAIFAAVSVYKLARLLWTVGRAVLCVVLVILPIPLVALITLVVVNQKATKVLTGHGLKVGLLGANGTKSDT